MQLLSVTQVADQVGLSEWAVRRAIHEGELIASKLRGRLRVDALDLEAWVQSTRVTPERRAPAPVPRFTPSTVPAGGSVRERLRRERAG